jgi:hypothetical protein
MLRVCSVSGVCRVMKIGPREQVVELDLLHAHLDRAIGREERIVGHDFHPEAQRAVGHDRADVAGTDQAERLASHFDTHEIVLRPFAGLGLGIGLGQLAGKREHQRDRVLGSGDRVAERSVHHHHALGAGVRDVDVVDPDPGAADHLEVGRGVEDLLGDLGRRADREAVVLADDCLELFGCLAGDDIDIAAALLEDAGGVGVHFVRDEDFGLGHDFVPSSSRT